MSRPINGMTVNPYIVSRETDDQFWARRAAERAAARSADPVGYAKRQAIRNLPSSMSQAERYARSMEIGRNDAPGPDEPEMHEAPGYHQHKMVDAITDAILAIREDRRRARPNQDERDALKAAFNPTFADVGLRLVCIPNWVRSERTIMEPRLR